MPGHVLSKRVRWAFSLGLWTAYFAVVILDREAHPTVVTPLVCIPLIATGILLGRRWGAGFVLASFPFTLMAHAFLRTGDSVLTFLDNNWFSWAVGTGLGWGTGALTETLRRERQQAILLKAEIDRRVKAETDQATVQRRWDTILSNATDTITMFDLDRRVLYVNHLPPPLKPSDVMGHRVEEFAGTPQEAALSVNRFKEAVLTGKANEHTASGPGGKGQYRVRFMPLSEAGRATAIMAMSSDITMEHAVESSYRLLADNASDLIQQFDAQGICIYASPSAKTLLGREPAELIGVTGLELLHPDDLAGIRTAQATAGPPVPGKSSTSLVRAHRKDGTWIWVEATNRPIFDAAGAYAGSVTASRDVTSRVLAAEQAKQGEARLADAQAVAHVGSWEWEFGSEKAILSPEMLSILGVEPHSHDGSLTAFLSRIHAEDRASMQQAIEGAIQKGHAIDITVRVVQPAGKIVRMNARGRVGFGPDGRPQRLSGTCQDVTAAHDAMEKVLASETLLLETQDLARIGSWEIDLLTGQQRGSAENHRLYDFAPGEAETQETILAHTHPNDRAALVAAVKQTVESGQTQLDHRIVLADGSLRWLRSNAQLRFDAAGKPSRILGFSQDMTEARQQTTELRLAKERFELASLATEDVLWDLDLVADRAWYSPTFKVQFGGAIPEQGSMAALLARVHSEDAARLVKEMQIALAGFGDTTEGVYRFRRRDDTWAHVRDRAYIVRDPSGKPVRLVGAMQDITEQVKVQSRLADSERRLKDLIDNLDEVFISDSLDGKPPLISKAAQSLFGRPAQDFMDDPQLWSRMLHPEDAPRVMASYGHLMAGQPTRDEARVVRADGTIRWMVSTMQPTKNAAGKVVRIDGTLRDITAEHDAAQQADKVKELEQVTSFKTKFLNNAAHELATPLTPIKLQMATVRAILLGSPDERQRRAVDILDRNFGRLEVLVGDLLDAARLQSGNLRISIVPMDAARVLRDLEASFVAKANESSISLAVQMPKREVRVLGDDARLTQVLFNLVHNAFKFTPKGGRIVVDLRQEGGMALLSVRDTGIGLTTEQIGRMFQPFSQVHDTTQLRVGGTGLGLYISRTITEQLHGSLTCASDGPNQGSVFELRLPLAPATPLVVTVPKAA